MGAKLDMLLNRMLEQRTQHLVYGDLENDYLNAMRIVFGEPTACLVCGEAKTKPTARDLDAWFCSAHCPVCAE